MSLLSPTSVKGVLAAPPAAVLGSVLGAPWWAVIVLALIALVSFIAVPIVNLALEHIRQRKGDPLEEKFIATLDQIAEPEVKLRLIITYQELKGRGGPAEPSPGPLPPAPRDSDSDPPET
ncbi:hypothetical protein [Actinacidiphila paucisporea]|uniref:Uncharacterized protein n=1 Tax=Actinacidiphila paucisporea TaxID=310782 RepID=A0A1M7QV24_9ACTN|nr:hypothetical protein [Actinacidiphila paucisporea]SHN35616.1 hypothetical protein SAMN05216499_1444 [Actinacidiphila paucisporea]